MWMVGMVFGAVLPGLVISWAAGFGIRRLAPGWGLVDRPNQRKVHARPMPTGGGLAIWLGVVLPLAAGSLLVVLVPDGPAGAAGQPMVLPPWIAVHLAGLRQQMGSLWTVLAGGTALMILGLVDDHHGIPWKVRLGVQTLIALALVLAGFRLTLFLDVPWLTATLSVFWIVGLVNSFNMLDNMDGLSAGVAMIAAGVLAAVMLMAPDPATSQPQLFVAGFLLVVVGALLGFLWHNRPPARLFMGDAGSYLIGYLLAIATLTATFAGSARPHSILAPLCVLAIPLYDTLTVVVIRLRAGRSPFAGDKSHFSHRLVELGMTKTQAVATIYLATATCGLGALLLYQVNLLGAGVILLMVACVLVLVAILETVGRRARNGAGSEDPYGPT